MHIFPTRRGLHGIQMGASAKLIVIVSHKLSLPLAMAFIEPKTKTFFGYWQNYEGKDRKMRNLARLSNEVMLDLLAAFDADWREKGWGEHEPWRIHSEFSGRTRDLLIRRAAASLGS